MSEDKLRLSTNILGCKFLIKFPKDIEILLVAETLLAFLEGFFATSISELMAHTEAITINIIRTEEDYSLIYTYDELTTEYNITVNNFDITTENRGLIHDSILNLTIDILVRHFMSKDNMSHIENLFKKEEIQERLSLIVQHRNFTINLLGDTPRLFFNNWIDYLNPSEYISKRKIPISYNLDIKKVNKEFEYKDLDKVRHNEIETRSVIDMPLWEEAKWKGFGFLLHPREGLGIFIAYENSDAGITIFNKWINDFGEEDKLDLVKITIIRGVDERNPYWYRVHISANVDVYNPLQSNRFFTVLSRVHEMNANTPENMAKLIDLFNTMKKYKLYPAKLSHDGKEIEPFFDKGILKTTLIIKDAWEIGENDLDRVVIKKNDRPLIPIGNTNAPVLKIINKAEYEQNM